MNVLKDVQLMNESVNFLAHFLNRKKKKELTLSANCIVKLCKSVGSAP